MDKPLKLRIFRDIANFEAQVIGNVLELQRDQVKLVYSTLYRFGHQRTGFRLLDGIGDRIRLVAVLVRHIVYIRIIGTKGNGVGDFPQSPVKQTGVAVSATEHTFVVYKQRLHLHVYSDNTKGDLGVHGGHVIQSVYTTLRLRLCFRGIVPTAGNGCTGNALAFTRNFNGEFDFFTL